jgi:hypothetical protein
MEDLLVVYGANSIQVITYVGGSQLFGITHILDGVNILSPGAIVEVFGVHFYLGQDNIYMFNGSSSPIAIGDPIADSLREDLSVQYSGRAFAYHDTIRHRVYWVIPTSDTASVVYIAEYIPTNLESITWSKIAFTVNTNALGIFSQVSTGMWNSASVSTIAWEDKSGSWNDPSSRDGFPVLVVGSSVGTLFKNSDVLDDAGTTFTATLDTPDISIPSEYLSVRGRYLELEFEAKGSEVDILYSTDQGVTWTSIETVTLSSAWTRYKVLFDVSSEFLRIRFRHDTAGDFLLHFWRIWATAGGIR